MQMLVTVKFFTGDSFNLEMESFYTISYLRQKISDVILIECHRLIFRGKQLQDEYTLAHYNITHRDSVFAITRS
jgi:hypothetical protein